MLENSLKSAKTVLTDFDDFIITDSGISDDGIWIKFTYNECYLLLTVNNPDKVYLRKVSVYMLGGKYDSIKLPPHFLRIDETNKLSYICLLDTEQHILTAYSLPEVIKLYLDQVRSILSLSNRQIEDEYLKEFEYYWNLGCAQRGKKSERAEIYLPSSLNASSLECWHFEKNEKCIIFPEYIKFNEANVPKGTKSSALYIPIEYPNGIIPPQNNICWGKNELLDIIYNQVFDRISPDSNAFIKKQKIDNYQKVIVFSFFVPNSVTITFSGILKFNNNDKKDLISKIQEDFKSFTPIKSSRMDMKYLKERVGLEYSESPAVLLVGCGSVGSYILPELVNMGIVDIAISDPDEFVSGNSMRHYLGPRSNGTKKVDDLKFYIEFQNPLVSIKIVSNLLGMNDSELKDLVNKYPIVVIATGGTDLQKEFNYRFSKIKNESWFLYNWLDAEGKGAHILAMRYANKGCFNCLFYENGKPITYNKVSYANGSEKVIGNGCGGSFSPYGNNVLIKNTSLFIATLQNIINGSITQNTVASIKNDFSTYENSVYMVPNIESNFADEGCDICGSV